MSVYHVQGRCPACQQDTLVLDGDHHVICDDPGCPQPDAASLILEAAR